MSTIAVRGRLLDALDPQGEVDPGLALTIAHQLSPDAASVLAELVDKRVAAERERIATAIEAARTYDEDDDRHTSDHAAFIARGAP